MKNDHLREAKRLDTACIGVLHGIIRGLAPQELMEELSGRFEGPKRSLCQKDSANMFSARPLICSALGQAACCILRTG
jgi:hypothetical protein